MFLDTSQFLSVAFALMIVFAIVNIYYRVVFKRRANVADVDQKLWHLRLFAGFFASLMFLALLYLPSTGFYRDIDLSPAARETAFQNLVYNQERLGTQLDQLRQVLYLIFIFSMFFLFGISTFMGRIWHDRQKSTAANDPATKKPLGLEL